MSDAPIYLDHNATTPIDPRVVEAMARAWQDCGANPASQHGPGRRARRMLEEAREGLAELLGAKTGGMNADRVIFTSGGTEANNLAVLGLAPTLGDRVLTSGIEHPSILVTTRERRLISSPRFDPLEHHQEHAHPAVVARAGTEPHVSDNEQMLVTQMRDGNTAATVQFWQRHHDGILHYVRKLVGCVEEAKHITTKAQVEMLLRSKREAPPTDVKAWLLAIVRDTVRQQARLLILPTSASGVINVERLGRSKIPFQLVSVMLANNETGVIQPIKVLAPLARDAGSLIHTDAVQAVGKIPVHFRELGVDAMTVAPHKFHGPLGIGALLLRHGVNLEPQLVGGFQQEGLRPGTENVALAVGFHEALKIATAELPERAARMQQLRDELEQLILAEAPDAVVIGKSAPRLPNTSCISFPGLDRQALVMALDLAGVACSTGSACASGSSEPSPTLVAMGLPKDVINGAIRLSLGAFTTTAEVAEAARRIIKAAKHLRSQKSS
ncbi:MAG TPA: aminotransferase class V-fold PLP-dependent enzyme [Pirellulales bacterium]|nr:aminotransferase class V-fold PLP-dependent enzyme [Pirellulales bacterium]